MNYDEPLTDALLAARALAPRITPDHIDSRIAEIHFVSPAEAVEAKGGQVARNAPIRNLTLCVLTLKNGFTVTGESACASPENFDAEIGKNLAFKDAREKIWVLEGYLLREQLASLR